MHHHLVLLECKRMSHETSAIEQQDILKSDKQNIHYNKHDCEMWELINVLHSFYMQQKLCDVMMIHQSNFFAGCISPALNFSLQIFLFQREKRSEEIENITFSIYLFHRFLIHYWTKFNEQKFIATANRFHFMRTVNFRCYFLSFFFQLLHARIVHEVIIPKLNNLKRWIRFFFWIKFSS